MARKPDRPKRRESAPNAREQGPRRTGKPASSPPRTSPSNKGSERPRSGRAPSSGPYKGPSRPRSAGPARSGSTSRPKPSFGASPPPKSRTSRTVKTDGSTGGARNDRDRPQGRPSAGRPERGPSDRSRGTGPPRQSSGQVDRPQTRTPRSRDTTALRDIGLDHGWIAELRDVAKDPERAGALAAKSLEAFTLGDYPRASSLAQEARTYAPRSPRIRELVGLCHYHTGRWQEAARELLTYRRLTGSVEQNHVIADCYRALKRPDRAIEITNEVKREDVEPEIWTELVIVGASAYADKADLRRAIAYLTKGDLEPKSVEPHHLRLWYVRSDLMEKAGQKEEAIRGWERISAEDPGFFDVAERLERR